MRWFLRKLRAKWHNAINSDINELRNDLKNIANELQSLKSLVTPSPIFDERRENILRIFRIKMLLCYRTYTDIIENAQKNNIWFSAGAAQDIIAYLFFYGQKTGFYIEIGANNGYNGSTTFWAEQLGWKGICIEPQSKTFEQLKKYRKCALYNIAISDENKKNIEFITFPERDYRSGFASTMTQKHIEKAKEFSYMSTTTVNAITFNDMMKDFPEIKHIDFMSIDTEGHEMNVLQSIDFDKYTFGLLRPR